MRLSPYQKNTEKYMWRCPGRQCSMGSIKSGSCFEGTKIPLKNWVKLMFLWSKEYSKDEISREINFNKKSVCNCEKFIRQVITTNVQNNPISLGGPGLIVHLDTNCLGHNQDKRKRNLNRTPIWVLGRKTESSKQNIS